MGDGVLVQRDPQAMSRRHDEMSRLKFQGTANQVIIAHKGQFVAGVEVVGQGGLQMRRKRRLDPQTQSADLQPDWATGRLGDGGASFYRRARPFFLGLILGQISVAGLWIAIDFSTGMIGNQPIGKSQL